MALFTVWQERSRRSIRVHTDEKRETDVRAGEGERNEQRRGEERGEIARREKEGRGAEERGKQRRDQAAERRI